MGREILGIFADYINNPCQDTLRVIWEYRVRNSKDYKSLRKLDELFIENETTFFNEILKQCGGQEIGL